MKHGQRQECLRIPSLSIYKEIAYRTYLRKKERSQTRGQSFCVFDRVYLGLKGESETWSVVRPQLVQQHRCAPRRRTRSLQLHSPDRSLPVRGPAFVEFGQVPKCAKTNSKRSLWSTCQNKVRAGAASECVCESRFVPKLLLQCAPLGGNKLMDSRNVKRHRAAAVLTVSQHDAAVLLMGSRYTVQSWNWQQGAVVITGNTPPPTIQPLVLHRSSLVLYFVGPIETAALL